MGRKIRLTESEFHNLVRRLVIETQDDMNQRPEMEEGMFSNIGKGLKRFGKGYGSDEELDEMRSDFMDQLSEMEEKMEEKGYEKTSYGSEENWMEEKENLIRQAEKNNFMGDLEESIFSQKFKLKYKIGKTGFQHMKSGLTSGAGGAVRSGMSKGRFDENRRYGRR